MPRPKRVEDDELLRIARAVFVLDGAHGSTREIAERAGISEAALFKRYPTKAELFLAAMMPPQVDAFAMAVAAERVADPHEALIAFSDRIVSYLREALPVIRQLTQTPLIELEDIRRRFGDAPAEQLITRALADYLAGQTERQRMRCPDPTGAAMLLFAALHSLVLFELMHFHPRKDARAAVRTMVAALWSGLSNGDALHA